MGYFRLLVVNKWDGIIVLVESYVNCSLWQLLAFRIWLSHVMLV